MNLSTGFFGGYDYTAGGKHPGVLLIGDVTGDGRVADDDKTVLIDLIDAGQSTDKNDLADFNRDGVLDLADLEYFVQGYQVDKDTQSMVEMNIPASMILQNVDGQTIAEGDLAGLTKEEGTVVLKRADGSAISAAAPVTLEFEILQGEMFGTGGIVIDAGKENPIASADLEITYVEEGNEQTVQVPVVPEGIETLLAAEQVTVTQDGYGRIEINLGTQVAVKRVTIRITGMKKNNNLAEIAKVEFVNDMENRIPDPATDIPTDLSAEAGSKMFTLTWKECVNITGYEVEIEDENGVKDIVPAKGNLLTVQSFKQEKLVNGKTYKVRVQSSNGDWRSGYSEVIEVIPKADKAPDAPDQLSAQGKYRAIDFSWKKMEDTDYYNLYFREKGTAEYTKVESITSNSYTVSDLKDKTEYEAYVTGVNEIGESKPSLTVKAQTTDPSPAKMPRYKLINPAGDGEVSEHIIRASIGQGEMKDSPLDTEAGSAMGTVDNNPISHYYVGTWDCGGYNPLKENLHGITYEFDQPYKMQRIALQEIEAQSNGYYYAQVRYWDEEGVSHLLTGNNGVSISRKYDEEERTYYLIKLPEPAVIKKIQIGLARYSASGSCTVSEVYFYHYDSLEDEIMALYEDDLHTVLREDVDQATIDGLRTRINTPDDVSGEYNPDKEYLERELQTAEDILNAVKLAKSVEVHSTISTSDVGRGFGGLNAWQPLGVTAAAGEEITVYVGHNTKKTGESTNLQLISTQYHSESSNMATVVAALKIGRNDITVPKLSSLDTEAGGALYVQYTGSNVNDRYAVRVSGGVEVPRLDLYKVTDSAERLARAEAYITELDAYVADIETKHNEVHKDSGNKLVQYDYKAADCILGASDIMLDTMMLSLPAQQILSGTGSGSAQDRAQKLVTSMDAIESMMNLFYQHKGLNNSASENIDQFPACHLNIRYQRMFAGAFMYASGNHIGIEWNETKGMMAGAPVQSDESGRYVSGRYFGWGVAHEIGHCINQGSYAVAEITNNYFSVLAQAKDTNESVRFQYNNVYDKVTSGTKGRASNVFTQLGMYWQLHLAYDSGYNYKTYENYEDQLNNLFFARVDTYSRTPSRAPAPGGIALTLSGGTDQCLMRLACAAAEKDILDFFERWGMTPDETTVSYAGQFAKETRAIYYVNDNSRVYRLTHGGSSLGTDGAVEAVGDGTTAVVNVDAKNQVDFTLSSKNINEEEVLGYEIVRCTISNGEIQRETAGFTTGNTFTDTITTMNNRVVIYEVTLIDQYLNRSAVKTLDAVKIEHKGNISKTHWSVVTNDMKATNVADPGEGDDESPCGPEKEAPIMKAVDNNRQTVYTGTTGANAEVVLEFNQSATVSGFQYTVEEGTPIDGYSIYVRDDENQWIEAASGTFGKSGTVYFVNPDTGYMALYQTTAVKLAIKNPAGTEIAISELDVLGVTGDNVDFRYTESGEAAIGKLKNDYRYGKEEKDVIPAESVVFTGTYKGSPAYNVVLLYDQDGNIVGGEDSEGALNAKQVLFTNVSESGNVEDTYDGTWIYWIEPENLTAEVLAGLKNVRAELYRVDNALTLEGQRLVSDSVFVKMPDDLPDIQISDQN